MLLDPALRYMIYRVETNNVLGSENHTKENEKEENTNRTSILKLIQHLGINKTVNSRSAQSYISFLELVFS